MNTGSTFGIANWLLAVSITISLALAAFAHINLGERMLILMDIEVPMSSADMGLTDSAIERH